MKTKLSLDTTKEVREEKKCPFLVQKAKSLGGKKYKKKTNACFKKGCSAVQRRGAVFFCCSAVQRKEDKRRA